MPSHMRGREPQGTRPCFIHGFTPLLWPARAVAAGFHARVGMSFEGDAVRHDATAGVREAARER